MQFLKRCLLILSAALVACTTTTTAAAEGPGFGTVGFRHHQTVTITPPPVVSGVTYDTSIGAGVDSNGFASLPLRTGASAYFVNSSTGSDSNTCAQAQSPSTPKATAASGIACFVAGEGDQLLVAEGTTYTERLPTWFTGRAGGYSLLYPAAIRSYDPTDPTNTAKYGHATGSGSHARPIFTGAETGNWIQGGNSQSFIAVQGIEINPGNSSGQQISMTDIQQGFLFENDILAYTSLTLDPFTKGQTSHWIIRNSSIYGSWVNSGTGGSCIYVNAANSTTIEDNVLYNCGWEIGATRVSLKSAGGSSVFTHPVYQQVGTGSVYRRNLVIDGSADGGKHNGNSVNLANVIMDSPIAESMGGGTSYQAGSPLGVDLFVTGDAALGSATVADSSGNPSTTDWGIDTANGRSTSLISYNILGHSTAQGSFTFRVNDQQGLPSYATFDHNISYLWSALGSSTLSSFNSPGSTANDHPTYSSNIWDDATAGTNTNNGSVSFANAYTVATASAALSATYPSITDKASLISYATRNPEAHVQRTLLPIIQSGYGLVKPTVSSPVMYARFVIGTPDASFVGGIRDGATYTASGAPSGLTIATDGSMAWSYDGTGTAGTGNIAITVTEADGVTVHTTNIPYVVAQPPVLSSVTATPGNGSVTVTDSTTGSDGSEYLVVSATNDDSYARKHWGGVRYGLRVDAASPAAASASQAVTSSGAQSITATGLTNGTPYWGYLIHVNAAGDPSQIAMTGTFTPVASSAPVLSSSTASALSSTSASIGVNTDTGSGTLYWVLSTSSTAPTAAQIEAGQDASGSAAAKFGNQTVSASGSQSATATGLSAATTYYLFWAQHTTVDSNVPSVVSFTTNWAPSALGTALAVDCTNFGMSNMYQATNATTPVTADGQTVKSFTCGSITFNAVNGTGWVWHANSGKPYLSMDGTESFRSSTTFVPTDASGQMSQWVTAQLTATPTFARLTSGVSQYSQTVAINSSWTVQSKSTDTAGVTTTDSGPSTAINTDFVASGVISTGSVEAFLNNVGSGGAATFTGTPRGGADFLQVGQGATGRLYGFFDEKGAADTTTKSNAQTYMAALHP